MTSAGPHILSPTDVGSPPLPEVRATADAPGPLRLLLPAWTLFRREMVRFFRQPNRVASAVASPLMLWVMVGFGLDRAFVMPAEAGQAAADAGYAVYFFPGIITMTLMFTAIFSTITVIEDRREGFLQGVMVSPASRLSVLLGKLLGGAATASVQAWALLVLWLWVADSPGLGMMLVAGLLVPVMATGLTAVGLMMAWRMDSTAGFHAVMMLGLMPMWFLSGAAFPLATAPPWLATLMWCNPLTWAHTTLAAAMHGQTTTALGLSLWPAAGITVGLALLAGLLTHRIMLTPKRDGTG